MGRSEDRLAQSEQAIKAIISGQVGIVPALSSRIDTDDSGQEIRGSRVRSMKVSQLKKVLDATKQGTLKKGSLEECVSSVSSAYGPIDHFQKLRRWLHIVIDTYELYTLDMYLAMCMIAKFEWWDAIEERERVRVMRTKKAYDWALDSLRQEMKLLEDVNKVLSRGSSTKPAVGMGFAGGSAGGSKSQNRAGSIRTGGVDSDRRYASHVVPLVTSRVGVVLILKV